MVTTQNTLTNTDNTKQWLKSPPQPPSNHSEHPSNHSNLATPQNTLVTTWHTLETTQNTLETIQNTHATPSIHLKHFSNYQKKTNNTPIKSLRTL